MERAKTILALTHPVTLVVALASLLALLVIAAVALVAAMTIAYIAVAKLVIRHYLPRPKARTVPVAYIPEPAKPVSLALAQVVEPTAKVTKSRKPRKAKPPQTTKQRRHNDHAIAMHLWHVDRASKADIARQLEVTATTIGRWINKYSA